jgi:hypothetical protein
VCCVRIAAQEGLVALEANPLPTELQEGFQEFVRERLADGSVGVMAVQQGWHALVESQLAALDEIKVRIPCVSTI